MNEPDLRRARPPAGAERVTAATGRTGHVDSRSDAFETNVMNGGHTHSFSSPTEEHFRQSIIAYCTRCRLNNDVKTVIASNVFRFIVNKMKCHPARVYSTSQKSLPHAERNDDDDDDDKLIKKMNSIAFWFRGCCFFPTAPVLTGHVHDKPVRARDTVDGVNPHNGELIKNAKYLCTMYVSNISKNRKTGKFNQILI